MGCVLGFYGSEGGTCFTVWKLELELKWEWESILGVKMEDDRGVSTNYTPQGGRVESWSVPYPKSSAYQSHHITHHVKISFKVVKPCMHSTNKGKKILLYTEFLSFLPAHLPPLIIPTIPSIQPSFFLYPIRSITTTQHKRTKPP
jgi:hypothetical protein